MNEFRTDEELQTRLRTQLRAALHADARRAEISPDAWAKVADRLPPRRPRRWRRPRPTGRRRVVLGVASVATAVVATVALATVIVTFVPSRVGGPLPESSDRPRHAPSAPATDVPDAKTRPTLADAAAGHDLRVRLVLRYGQTYRDGATVLLLPYRWRDGGWTPVAAPPAVVGRAGSWTVEPTSLPSVCELRVVAGSALRQASTVRIRLASGRSEACSGPYEFTLVGDRLEER